MVYLQRSSHAERKLYFFCCAGFRRENTACQTVSPVGTAGAVSEERAWKTFVVFPGRRIALPACLKKIYCRTAALSRQRSFFMRTVRKVFALQAKIKRLEKLSLIKFFVSIEECADKMYRFFPFVYPNIDILDKKAGRQNTLKK